jgi:tRNA dimethylallyltransferase
MSSPFYRDRPPVIAVLGPTATGKTDIAIELALRYHGEVVSVDSRYLYRGLDIGTAKPPPEERRGVPHHLIDILTPDEEYSLALYQQDAYSAIDAILRRDHLPIVAGGSPLYVRAVLEGWRIPRAAPDPDFRGQMELFAQEHGSEALHERLRQIDPTAADRTPPRNIRRVIRALEVYHQTGRPMSEQEGKEPPPYRILRIGLHIDRETLFQRIDQRVDTMFQRGLVEEIKSLLAAGVSADCTAMQTIGYQEVIPYLRGEYDYATMVERIKFSTHRYVRHQMTWLRKTPDINWIDILELGSRDQIYRLVDEFLTK